ncbi:hypothetical protein GUITHDRAFT_122600 [Guillardia theta CCMP2712]|uniref:Uncharacterized protein n=1 Tax=Guillardia theta (strain CCMP2712) TaxID=905079 RepID=L1I4L6_GUITC|nr:hypothetical protein GUITHDRAFT_122600 [Guillardia theta CCMP2712]EKX31191.1 hypothetical protein GUITHDRAFT_122600 [Guillardia theta CCMP2712]|eukprot:XP_005818171.1 hypothetical protein GUITHDRAFT_122600 [Guillardia theta CCMP2712]
MKKFVSCLDLERIETDGTSKNDTSLVRNSSRSSSLSDASTICSCGTAGDLHQFVHPTMDQIVVDKKHRFHVHEIRAAASEIEQEAEQEAQSPHPLRQQSMPSKAEMYFFHELSQSLCRSEAADWFASQVLKGRTSSSPEMAREVQGMKRNSSMATFSFSGRRCD